MAKMEEMVKDVTFESIIDGAVKIPGVKVNRNEFLTKFFENENVDTITVLEKGPLAAGVLEDKLSEIAEKLIMIRTSESSAASFVAGLPGGLALAATIPADMLQFFGMNLRLAQELAYLYGAKDFWKRPEEELDAARDQLIMYLGVMFEVQGAAAASRLVTAKTAKETLDSLPEERIAATDWKPLIRAIGKDITINMTKDTAAKGVSKVLPIIGGLLSGGITFAVMGPMGRRLADVLDVANFHISAEEVIEDFEYVEKIAKELLEKEEAEAAKKAAAEEAEAEDTDGEDIEAEIGGETEETAEEAVSDEEEKEAVSEDVFATLEKLAKLRDAGAITEEDYNVKKAELLARI